MLENIQELQWACEIILKYFQQVSTRLNFRRTSRKAEIYNFEIILFHM